MSWFRRSSRAVAAPVPRGPPLAPTPAAAPPPVTVEPPVEPPEPFAVEYAGHNLPSTLPAMAVFPARLTLRNTSGAVWLSTPPDGRSVDLVMRFGDEMVATHKLPAGELWPGRQVTVRFAFTAPAAPGRLRVQFELVQQQVALFRDRGVPPLVLDLDIGPPLRDAADDIWNLAVRHNPWHYQPTRGIARGADGRRYPVFTTRTKGCHVWDQSGRRYIDYVMGWGAVLLGYADEHVQRALHAAVDLTAPMAPFPHRLEMEVAAMLAEDIPCAEMSIFGKNGSDVCTVAARAARVLTGRRTILYCGYHGWQDWWIEQHGFAATGVPERERPLLHRFRFNDREDFLRLYELHKADLAAVFIEPAGPWGGNDIGWEADADGAFLELLRDRAHAVGALLVFDEIVTGYRYPGHSVQQARGVVPDMACLGKALASGLPLSALVGRADLFRSGLPRTWFGPTFKWEIYSFAAARAAIEVYRSRPVARHVWDYGTRLQEGIGALLSRTGASARLTGPPFRFALVWQDADRDRLALKKALFVQEMLARGLSTYNGIMLPSFAHGDVELVATLRILEEALEAVTDAARRDDFSRLEIPPLVDL